MKMGVVSDILPDGDGAAQDSLSAGGKTCHVARRSGSAV